MKHALLFLALLALLSACKKESPLDVPQPVSNRIRFDALAVGQISSYIGLNGNGYFTDTYDDFEYTDDTLYLEIVAKDSNGYKIAETMHYDGFVHNWLVGEKDSTLYYYIRVSNDSLRLTPPIGTSYFRSRIFKYHASKYGLPLSKITSPKVEILGWKTSFPLGGSHKKGFAENYSLFGKIYDHLNVIVENSAFGLDGNGETYIFSKPFGIVRFSTYSPWTGGGYGWDLLPPD